MKAEMPGLHRAFSSLGTLNEKSVLFRKIRALSPLLCGCGHVFTCTQVHVCEREGQRTEKLRVYSQQRQPPPLRTVSLIGMELTSEARLAGQPSHKGPPVFAFPALGL